MEVQTMASNEEKKHYYNLQEIFDFLSFDYRFDVNKNTHLTVNRKMLNFLGDRSLFQNKGLETLL